MRIKPNCSLDKKIKKTEIYIRIKATFVSSSTSALHMR